MDITHSRRKKGAGANMRPKCRNPFYERKEEKGRTERRRKGGPKGGERTEPKGGERKERKENERRKKEKWS